MPLTTAAKAIVPCCCFAKQGKQVHGAANRGDTEASRWHTVDMLL